MNKFKIRSIQFFFFAIFTTLQKFHDLINDQIEDNASHDFDVISHEGCNYDNPGKGLQVDVEKVVGSIFGGDQVILNNPNKSFTTVFNILFQPYRQLMHRFISLCTG